MWKDTIKKKDDEPLDFTNKIRDTRSAESYKTGDTMGDRVSALEKKVRRKLEQDILEIIDDLEMKAGSYTLNEAEEKRLKEVATTLREMFKGHSEPAKRPVFGGKGRIKDVQFSDE